jgi:hypothetical protein
MKALIVCNSALVGPQLDDLTRRVVRFQLDYQRLCLLPVLRGGVGVCRVAAMTVHYTPGNVSTPGGVCTDGIETLPRVPAEGVNVCHVLPTVWVRVCIGTRQDFGRRGVYT